MVAHLFIIPLPRIADNSNGTLQYDQVQNDKTNSTQAESLCELGRGTKREPLEGDQLGAYLVPMNGGVGRSIMVSLACLCRDCQEE